MSQSMLFDVSPAGPPARAESPRPVRLGLPTPDQCRKWWSLLASSVLTMSAEGKRADEIAKRLGVPAVDVERVLVPVPPTPPDRAFLMREPGLAPLFMRYPDLVRATVDRLLWPALLMAGWQARAAGREALARTLHASAALACSRADAAGELLGDVGRLDARALESCALEDARAALGVEPLPDPADWLLFRFCRSRHVAALVEAAQAHVEAGKPLPKLRAALARRTRARDVHQIDGAEERIAGVAAAFGAPVEGT